MTAAKNEVFIGLQHENFYLVWYLVGGIILWWGRGEGGLKFCGRVHWRGGVGFQARGWMSKFSADVEGETPPILPQ